MDQSFWRFTFSLFLLHKGRDSVTDLSLMQNVSLDSKYWVLQLFLSLFFFFSFLKDFGYLFEKESEKEHKQREWQRGKTRLLAEQGA